MFGYGQRLRDIPENTFQRWIKYLMNIPDVEAIYIALELFHSFYGRKTSKAVPPATLTLPLLAHPLFFNPEAGRNPSTMDKLHWTEVGKYFVNLYPDNSLELAYRMIASSDRYFLLEISPSTGRHHQIRAQLAAIGCPVKGDLKYGSPRSNPGGGIHLHARKICFEHPTKKTRIEIVAPVPDEPLWQVLAHAAR